jgi:7,8-dihydropterin-6-yl-methyl-4-(beta-D-ribofuranosyl)aminobenzene 5'-phosphate synthase
MRVTALVENSRLEGRDDLQPEFGLSLHVELNGTRVLFDTGASAAFARNATTLGIDIPRVDVAVISHHHFDHGGGIGHFLAANDRAPIYLREGPLTGRWFKAFAVVRRPIGLDLALLGRFPDRIDFVSGMHEVAAGVHLLTGIGSAHQRPRGNRYLFVESGGKLVRDPFDHELMMVVRVDEGMVVFSGCSHHGILNMIDTAIASFPDVPIKAVFGGFHLIGLPYLRTMAATRAEVREIGRQIMAKVKGTVYTGHCTGDRAFSVLEDVMGETLRLFPTGASVTV